MRLHLKKQYLGAFAVLALTASANHLLASEGSFIVASEVVSDTAAPASAFAGDTIPATAFVGDLDSTTISDGCVGGDCSGGCENGSCATGGAGGRCSGGGCLNRPDAGYQPRKYDQSDLFYNFYSQGNYNQANAQMYISPVPVPHFVGHTFNTYQPLYPHEFMYWHKNRYHNNYDNGRGMNRTKVKYYAPPIRTAAKNLYWNKLRIPR